MFNYDLLEESIKSIDALEDFDMVNKQIDTMLLDGEGKVRKIKALICHYEGKLNKSNTYTVIAISFALIIGACSLLLSFYREFAVIVMVMYILLLLMALCIGLISATILKKDYKRLFILKVLYFKLEESSKVVKNQESETEINLKKHIIKLKIK